MISTDFLQFNSLSYRYPAVSGDLDENGNQILPPPVFDGFTAQLPGGFVSLAGPNGCGKSTLLLLAAGRLCPQHGSVHLFGTDTRSFFTRTAVSGSEGFSVDIDLPNPEKENEKNALASFIYQNMEFEDDGKAGQLLEYVFENGCHSAQTKSSSLYNEVLKVFSLENILTRKLNIMAKGEIQRVLLAFSVLYGARSIFMDEPMFALEYHRKEAALDYLKTYSAERNIPVYISMHEIDLTRKYAQYVLLMQSDRTMEFGTPEEVLTNESLEKAYGVPAAMLKDAEKLKRTQILEETENKQA